MFKLNELFPDIFNCLISEEGLIASKDAEIQARLLTKLEQDLN